MRRMMPKWPPGRAWADFKRLAGLEDLKWLADDVKRLGSHQLEGMQGAANAAIEEVEAAVRRNPFAAVAIALGAGFLYGVLSRR